MCRDSRLLTQDTSRDFIFFICFSRKSTTNYYYFYYYYHHRRHRQPANVILYLCHVPYYTIIYCYTYVCPYLFISIWEAQRHRISIASSQKNAHNIHLQLLRSLVVCLFCAALLILSICVYMYGFVKKREWAFAFASRQVRHQSK